MASYWPKYGQGHSHWNVDIMYDKTNYTIKQSIRKHCNTTARDKL